MDHRPPRPDQPYAWDDERLSAYLDGELSAPEQAQLEARLVVDPELRQLVDELRAVRQQLEILPEYRLKPTFADQVLRRAEQEMLLSPLGREAVEPVVATAAPLVAATSAVTPTAVVQPAVTTLPTRLPSRRWRRGAIWTAIAAAAVLLLIVTNRPNAPQQEHVARNEFPDPALPKPNAAKDQVDPAASPAGIDKTLHDQKALAAKESDLELLAKPGERESRQWPLGPMEPSVTISVGDAKGSNNAPSPPASAFGAAAAPKQDAAPNMKPDANQLARTTGGDKPSANQLSDDDRQAEIAKNQSAGAPGKPLLKSPAPSSRKGTQEKQTAAPREKLSAELTALLASEEFSRLAREEEDHADSMQDPVLVVYMTPRDALRGESAFASLLESNSIGLAEKTLLPRGAQQLQSSFALSTLEAEGATPLAKAESKEEHEARAKDRKAAETRDAGKAEQPSNAPLLRKETASAPASDAMAVANKTIPANEMYYLEADASQVDELLRQLRSSSAQFSRLNIMPQSLKLAESKSQSQDEKSTAKKQAASLPQAAKGYADDSRAEGVSPLGGQYYGNQPTGEPKQLAQGAAPAPASIPVAPAGAVPPPATTPAAPAAEPFASPAPVAPKENAVSAAPAALPIDAPAAADGASSFGDAKGGFGQSDNSTSNNGMGNRRASQGDNISLKGVGDRAIAYRLRGVETLLPAKNSEPVAEASAGGSNFGGGAGDGAAMAGKAEFDKSKAGAAAKPDNAAKRGKAAKAEPAKPGDARGQMKSENGAQQPEAPTTVAPTKTSPGYSAQEKKMEQQRPSADSPGAPEKMPTPSESRERQLERVKVAANAHELSLAESSALAGATASSVIRRSNSAQEESAKKAAPTAASKRVRVLFVIEHEVRKE